MREWCQCGSGINTLSKRQVKQWRTNHRHDAQSDPEPDKQGSEARVELAWPREYESDNGMTVVPVINARIGFVPND